MRFLIVLCILWTNSECSKILSGRKGIAKYDIEEGETLTLTCKADPTNIRTYRWVYIRETQKPRVRVLSSGRRLVVADSRFSITAERTGEEVDIVLKLKDIRPYETGLFMCWKQNKKPDPQVYVRVLEKDFTEAEPKSAEISGPNYTSFGNAATIKCIIRPTFSGKIIWTKDGQVIPADDHIYKQLTSVSKSGEVVASLEITIAREDGNYTCKTDSEPPTFASFHLIVRVSKIESLTIEPQKDEVYYGDEVTLTCVTSGSKEEILWMRDKAYIPSNETVDRIVDHHSIMADGNQKSQLVVRSFSIDDNGQYVCYVPGDSKYVHINIEGRAPKMVGTVSWAYLPGSVVQFTCSVQYTKGQNMVSWLFEGDELPEDWYVREINQTDNKNVTTFRLDISVLPGTLGQYIGVYTCSTPFANVSTSLFELVPLIIGDSPPDRIEVAEGEPLSLRCSIFGYIAPMVYWEKFMDNNWKMVEETNAEGAPETLGIEIITQFLQFENNTMGEHQEIIVNNTLSKHAGQYQCKGTNNRDTVVLATQVYVALLPRVVGMTADEITVGENLIITCSVVNWNESVYFIHEATIIDPGENSRYSVRISNNNEANEEEDAKIFTLRIIMTTIDDQGSYECHAGNETFDSVIAVVNPNPPDIIELVSSPAMENSDVFISCTIKNMPLDEEVIFSYEQMNLNYSEDARYNVHVAEVVGVQIFNMARIAREATYVLQIENMQPTDSGEYHCSIGPKYKDVMSTLYIDVEGIDKDDNILLDINSSTNDKDLVLNCTVTKWKGKVSFFHNETLLLEEDDRFQLTVITLDGSTSHLLQMIGWSDTDAGRYQCFTTPFAYADITITTEEIKKMFERKIELSSLDFKQLIELPTESAGPKLSLQCLVPADPQEILFTHNGVIFAQSDPTAGDFVHSRATLTHLEAQDEYSSGLKLTLSEIDSEDLGYWHCTARYSEPHAVLNASLAVEIYVPSKFTEVPNREIKVIPGAVVTLNCVASGLPLVQVEWLKKNTLEVMQSGREAATLQIEDFSSTDEGVYMCRASNEHELLEYETTLSLDRDLRIIDMPPPEVVVEYGDDVDLTCISTGSISPTVDWVKGTDGRNPLITKQDFATLSMHNITEDDLGVYTCRASILETVVTQITQLVLPMESSSLSTTINAPTLLMGRLIHLSGPSDVKVGDNFTMTCLVSPLLDLYVTVIVYNDFVITVGDSLLSSDPRTRINIGYGGMGERLYKLTVHSAKESDSGNYECQVNTTPLARHVHHINVTPEGKQLHQKELTNHSSLTTQESTPEAFTSIITTESPIKNIYDITPSTFDSVIIKGTDTIAAEDGTDGHELRNIGMKEDPKKVLDPTDDVIPVIIEAIGPIFAPLDDTISIPCTTTSMEMPIIWLEERRQRLLFVDGLDVGQNPRFKLEKSLKEEINGKTNTLVIEQLHMMDAGNYSCYIPHNDTTRASIEIIVVDIAEIISENDLNATYEQDKFKLETTVEKSDSLATTTEKSVEESKSDELDIIKVDASETENQSESSEIEYSSESISDEDYKEEKSEKLDISDTDYDDKSKYKIATEDLGATPEYKEELDNEYDEITENISIERESIIAEGNVDEIEFTNDNESLENGGDAEISQEQSAEETIEDSNIDDEESREENSYKPLEKVGHTETAEDRAQGGSDDQSDEYDITEVDDEEKDTSETEADLHSEEIHKNVSFPAVISQKNISVGNLDEHITTSRSETNFSSVKIINEDFMTSTEPIYSFSDSGFRDSKEYWTTVSYETSPPMDISTLPEIQRETSEYPVLDQTTAKEYFNIGEDNATYIYSIDVPAQTTTMVWHNTSDVIESTTTKIADGIGDTTEHHEHPVLVATPGKDIRISEETELIMPCPTDGVTDDITWKSDDKLLFLGSLDLAGVEGIQLTPKGQLRLLSGSPELKNAVSYTCFVYDYDNYDDTEVMSYQVNLINVEATPVEKAFYGPNWYSAVVAPSSKYSAQILAELLQDTGLITRPVDNTNCSVPAYIEGWENAQSVLKTCLQSIERTTKYQNIFIALDILAKIPFNGKYVTSLLYVSNKAENISSHIYGALTPVTISRDLSSVQCGTAIYENGIEDRNFKKACKESIEKSISILWGSYKSKMITV